MNELSKMCPDMEYVAVSPEERDRAAVLFGVDPRRIGVVNNSKSVRFAGITTGNALSFYLDHQLYKTGHSVWFVPSRMTETKYLEAAIYAVDQANRNGMDVRLVIATPAIGGRFPDQGADGDYFRRLVEIKRSLGPEMADKILFYPHSTGDMEEIGDWYRLSDAHIFPSQVETYGMTVGEAHMNGKPVFRVNLPELNRLTGGYNQAVIERHDPSWGSIEAYGRHFGEEIIKYYSANPGLVGIAQGKRWQIWHLSSEANIGILSPWFNIPPSSRRGISIGSRNFRGEIFETAAAQAAEAGFSSFEINFDGFSPWEVMPEDYLKIRTILAQKSPEGLRIGIRLSDFYKWTDRPQEEILKNAARVALELGATSITVPVTDLNEEFVTAVNNAAQWAQEEARRLGKTLPQVLFSIENVTVSGQLLSSEQLNSAFENKSVGVSVWLDSLPEKQIDYIAGMHMVVKELYFGGAFGNKDIDAGQRRALVDKSVDLMRWMHEQGWVGDAVVHISDGSLVDRRSFFDDVIRMAYVTKDVVASLESGTVTAPPTLKAVSPVWEAGVTSANGVGLVSTVVGRGVVTVTGVKSGIMDNAVRAKTAQNINRNNAGVLIIGDSSGTWFSRLKSEGFDFVWSAASIEEATQKGYFNENIILVVNAGVDPGITERLREISKGVTVLQLRSNSVPDQKSFCEYLESV